MALVRALELVENCVRQGGKFAPPIYSAQKFNSFMPSNKRITFTNSGCSFPIARSDQGDRQYFDNAWEDVFNVCSPLNNILFSDVQTSFRIRISRNNQNGFLLFTVYNSDGSRHYGIKTTTQNIITPFENVPPQSISDLYQNGWYPCDYNETEDNRLIMFYLLDDTGDAYNGQYYLCFGIVTLYGRPNPYFQGMTANLEYWGINTESYDEDYGTPSTPDGYNPNPTGYPDRFDDSSDPIPVPPTPSISVSNLGYLNTYKVTASGLSGMINELFPEVDLPDFPTPTGEGSLSDVANAMSGTGKALVNFCINFANMNIMQYVIDTHLLPVTPSTSGTTAIKVGYRTLSTVADKVSSDYVDFDCGTISIGEYYSNFIDYVGTTAQLYLPFVGYVPLKPELFLNGKLKVVYRFNIIDGSFVAFVLSTSSKSKLADSVIGTYSGNCCVHIPIVGSDFATICSGLVGGVSNSLNLGSIGSALGSSVGALSDKVESTINTVLPLKGNTSSSNGYNATSSYTGIRYPYLVINRQVADYSQNYQHENGIPLNVTKKLSDVTGYTVCSNPHIDMFCTEDERKMIYDALTTGVIL